MGIDVTGAGHLRSHWWIPLVRGLLSIAFGIVFFALPLSAVFTLVIVFGAFAFSDGILAVIQALRFAHPDRGRWWFLVLQGIAGVAIGVVTFLAPGVTAQTLGLLIAAWAIVTGVLEIGAAFRLRRDVPNELSLLVAGIVSIVFGVLMLVFFPIGALLAVVYLLAAYALIWGVTLVVLSLRLRRGDAAPHPRSGTIS